MKRLTFLFCAMLMGTGAFISAQSNQQGKDEHKRIVIVKKSVDEKGDVFIEKIIGEGNHADRILKKMVFREDEEDVSITVLRDIEAEEQGTRKERLFMIRKAGGGELEGLIDHDADILKWTSGDGIVVSQADSYEGLNNVVIVRRIDDAGHAFNWHGEETASPDALRTNCAALGVYVSGSGIEEKGGVRISSLIGGGGAEESGLHAGDHLLAVDALPVNNYKDLLKALSRYVPGEDVNVTFRRDGREANTVVTLKAWGEMPTMANTWRARVACDEKEELLLSGEEDAPVPALEAPTVPSNLQNKLALQDFHVFPNPSEGKFRVQFNATASPLTVRVTDLTGKEVYRDQVNRFDGIYNKHINLRKSGPGSYLLTIEQNGSIFTEQIVVQ